MKKNFVFGYVIGCLLFFMTGGQNLNVVETEKSDLRSIKNEIRLLNSHANKSMYFNIYQSSIYDTSDVSVKTEKPTAMPIEIKTKRRLDGKNSIFVDAFQSLQMFPTRPKFNYYDPVENIFVQKSVMLKAHLTCMRQVNQLPRQIEKKDKTVKFGKKYSGLFKKKENFEKVFGYSLYLENNIGRDASNNKKKQGAQRLFKKYGETSKDFLRKNLFENPCIIKSEKCRYLDTSDFVTIYYDKFTDLFAIVDFKKNYLIDFGIATEVKYAEIFAYKSAETVQRQEMCSTSVSTEDSKSSKSTDLQVYQYIFSYDDALDILEKQYGSNFLTVKNGEFKIEEWQAAKKIEHAVCFGIKPENFGFSKDQAKQINGEGGIVGYVRKGNKLPSLDLIRAFQNAIKKPKFS